MKRVTYLALATCLIAASPAKHATKAPAVASGSAYAASIQGIDCSNIVQRADQLKPLIPILRAAIRTDRLQLEKDEYETSAAYEARQAAHLRALMGGTDRFIAAIPLQSYNFTYHPDEGEMSAGGPFDQDLYHFGRDYGSAEVTIQIFRDELGTQHYAASNAYGATREVERTDKIRLALLLGKGEVPKLPLLKMSVPDARRLKENPMLLVVGELRPPYVSYAFDRSEATITYPYETRLGSYALSARLQCAVLTGGGREYYRWTF